MFGTCARFTFRPENREPLTQVLARQMADSDVAGFVSAHLLFPQDREGEGLMFVAFEDRASYMKNADDPAQNDRYLEFRALMESDPEWTDGEIVRA